MPCWSVYVLVIASVVLLLLFPYIVSKIKTFHSRIRVKDNFPDKVQACEGGKGCSKINLYWIAYGEVFFKVIISPFCLIYRFSLWLVTVDGIFALLTAAIVAALAKVTICGDSGKFELQTIAIIVAISALIPSMISKIIAKNQIKEIVDEKFEKELSKFNASLLDIRREKGHSSRMSATLLNQMAGVSTSDKEKLQNAAWSIGWASDAIIQYLLVMPHYSNALKRCSECIDIIQRDYDIISGDKKSFTDDIKLHARDLVRLVIMHSLLELLGHNDIKGIEYSVVDVPDLLQDIEVIFSQHIEGGATISSNRCTITGKPEDFNKEIQEKAKTIIENFTNKEKCGR